MHKNSTVSRGTSAKETPSRLLEKLSLTFSCHGLIWWLGFDSSGFGFLNPQQVVSQKCLNNPELLAQTVSRNRLG